MNTVHLQIQVLDMNTVKPSDTGVGHGHCKAFRYWRWAGKLNSLQILVLDMKTVKPSDTGVGQEHCTAFRY